jgi:uncharacterized protein (DUF1697 family)
VRTHLQSGNAVFDSERSTDAVVAELTGELTRRSGFGVDCVLRTAAELRAVVEADPLGEVATDPARYLVSFLADKPEADWPPPVDPAAYEPERFAVRAREAYFWCPDGVHGSPMLRAFSAAPTGVVATARNWNTVTRLLALTDT